MKRVLPSCIVTACWGLLLLAGCGPASTTTSVAALPTATPTVTASATPTHTPTRTWTPTPTDTPHPTDTPIPTPTALPTSTPDPDPDHDGVPNWEEQVYGMDPNAPQDWSNFDFVSSALNTPQRNSTYMMNNLEFIYDDPSNPNYVAIETFQRGGGDCEDLAAFAVHNLRRAGISSSLLDVQWGNLDSTTALGHAVAMYYEGESYWYIGTGRYDVGRIYGPFQDVAQVANHISPSWLRWTRFSETFALEERVYK